MVIDVSYLLKTTVSYLEISVKTNGLFLFTRSMYVITKFCKKEFTVASVSIHLFLCALWNIAYKTLDINAEMRINDKKT